MEILLLADGQQPPVQQLGKIWACEWLSPARSATVQIDGERFDLPLDRRDGDDARPWMHIDRP